MLEDSKMDKKTNNRSSQPQSRAPAVDCKKTELTQRPWPRSNKKREGAGSASKNEPYRKNVPAQRGRGQVDRRPRPRGPGGYAMGGMEISRIADDEPELGSVFVPGIKKQNLNHLLNFMYTPRGARASESASPAPRRSNQQRAFVPHNNELYLQACCQFVVKEDGDYKGNLLDPDIPVKWDLIEEIVVRSTGKSECPICLGAPVAGRVGRCGHVHCWPCALHYAAAHERQPPPCPVCAAPFRVELMRPARMLQWDQPNDEVTMRLVRRPRGSTVVEAAPARGLIQDASAEILPVGCISTAPYSKLFVASKQQVHEILLRERKELEDQILAEIDTTEVVYMEQALQMLKRQEENLNQEVDKPNIVIEEEVPIVYEKQETNMNVKKIDWFDVNEDEEGAQCMEKVEEQLADLAIGFDVTLNPEAPEFELNNNTPDEFPLLEETPPEDDVTINDIDKENQAKYFYFYQAEDGQQVFLNSLNVRILNASWGALAAAPAIIKGRVLQQETFSLSDQTRKHMPFTAHLPLHCPFDIVELELKPPFVTDSALHNYSDELDRRARARARSEREERRRERACRRAIEGPPKPDFSSELLFPPTSPPNYTAPISVVEESPPLPPPSSGSGLSFAKMAGTGGAWRVHPTPPPRAPSPLPDDSAPRALYLSAPRALYLSDAIEAALAAPHSGKKKRGKQKVLFSMGMQRSE